MSAQQAEVPDAVADPGESVNEVRLVGRVKTEPEQRELSSGDVLVTMVVEVARPPLADGGKPRQKADQLECAVWERRLQKVAAKRRPGELVEVTGALRRRFFQAAGSTASRTDVEVSGLRVIRRARSG